MNIFAFPNKINLMKSSRVLLFLIFLLPFISFSQESNLYRFLKDIPGAEVLKKDTTSFEEFYIVMLPQPVDHNNPQGPAFKQRIYVGHQGFDRPVVMETEGYGAERVTPYTRSEPTRLLNANQ